MRQAGFFSCFIVDDNFIGNKKLAKELLRLIIRGSKSTVTRCASLRRRALTSPTTLSFRVAVPGEFSLRVHRD